MIHIKKRNVEAHGHTKDCAGCRAMFQGGTRQNHSAECRERFRGLLGGDDRVKRMAEKRKDYEDRLEDENQRQADKKKKKEEKRAEKTGRKRAAEDDDLEEERANREAPDEGEEAGDRQRFRARRGRRRRTTAGGAPAAMALAWTSRRWRAAVRVCGMMSGAVG